jgi:hypothetical protein
MKAKRTKVLLATVAVLAVTSAAAADEVAYSVNEYHPDVSQSLVPRHRWLGVQADVGVPDGAALGLVIRPKVDWLRLEAAGTYNALALGGRLGLTLDPISFPVAPTLTFEGGFAGQGTVPGHANLPGVGYGYVNFHLGLELGNRDSWRFFVHGGPSFLHVTTSNFQNGVGLGASGVTLADPTADVWVVPAFKLGLALYF